jgi:membrane protein implicated in regulation of membrane protease activity
MWLISRKAAESPVPGVFLPFIAGLAGGLFLYLTTNSFDFALAGLFPILICIAIYLMWKFFSITLIYYSRIMQFTKRMVKKSDST